MAVFPGLGVQFRQCADGIEGEDFLFLGDVALGEGTDLRVHVPAHGVVIRAFRRFARGVGELEEVRKHGRDHVFDSGPPVEDTERFRAIGNPVSTIVAELLDFFLEYHKDEKWGFVGAPLHDPCTIAWLLKPELFTSVERWVGVETQGKYTQGMTVVDYYYLTGNKPNATVMVDVDRQGFVDLLADRLKFYA